MTSPKGRKRLLVTSSGFLIVLFAALAIGEWMGWPFLRAPLEKQLSSKLQRQVNLGHDFRLHLLGSIRVQTNTLIISPPEWDGPDFVSAREIQLELPYRSILGALQGNSDLEITLLDVGQINARLIREASGRANWEFGNEAGGGTAVPRFRKLVVRDGRLKLQDAMSSLYINATATLEEGEGNKEPGLWAAADGHFQEKTFSASAYSPGLLPLVAPDDASTPIELSLKLQAGESNFSFTGHATNLLQFGGLNGAFTITGPSLAAPGDALGLTFPATDAFSMQGILHKQKTLWDITVTSFKVAQSHLSGSFQYDTAALQPHLTGKIRGTELALQDLAPAFGAPSDSETASEPVSTPRDSTNTPRRVLPQREFDIPSLRRMDADIDVRIDKATLGSLFALPLQPLQGRLTLNKGELKLDKFLARTADGELRGQMLLDSRQATPLWAVNLDWSGIKLEKWLSMRNSFARKSERIPPKTPGEPPEAPPFVTGKLAGQAKLRGYGSSTASMLGSLEGNTYLWIRDGSISQLVIEGIGLDAAQGLGLLIRGDKGIPLGCAAVSMTSQKGKLQTDIGIVDTPDSLILLTGNISLADENLDLSIKAKPHDNSFLALRSPIHIKGSFSSPRIRPDMGRIAVKAGAATVLGIAITPLAALLPLLDPSSTTTKDECNITLAKLKNVSGSPSPQK